MAEELYITLEHEGSDSFVEKKSEFIGYAAPCKTEEEALDFIAKIQKKHADAKHNVYAYLIKENNIMRFSDAGEPQGSAGMPVLDVIRKSGFTDACIVVTRYFGGILLGVGGLVRAYSHAAKLAVDAAHIITYERFSLYEMICDYTDYEKIRYALPEYGVIVDDTAFSQDVTLRLAVRVERETDFCRQMQELTNGTILLLPCGERYDYLR